MAGRNLRRDAQVDPVAQRNDQVCTAQHSKAEAGCVPENELECACRQLRRLRQQSRGGHHACWVEQLGGRTGVASVRPSCNQNLAGCEQGREMVATPTNQWQGWRPFSSGGIVQFRGSWKSAAKIANAAVNQDLAARQQSGGVDLARLAHGNLRRPNSRGWIIYLCDNSVPVALWRGVFRPPASCQVPPTGSYISELLTKSMDPLNPPATSTFPLASETPR